MDLVFQVLGLAKVYQLVLKPVVAVVLAVLEDLITAAPVELIVLPDQ
jgi:hypothetical protein